MAYPIFERPKLQSAKSMKFYHEEFDRPSVSYRHKDFYRNLDPEEIHSHCHEGDKIPKPKVVYKKSPIYVHNFEKPVKSARPRHNEDTQNFQLKHKSSPVSAVINKLEETYWAKWKPTRPEIKQKYREISNRFSRKLKINEGEEIPQKSKMKQFVKECQNDVIDNFQISKNKSEKATQEIQTDILPLILTKDESIDEPEDEVKVLKHTDSFILNMKRQAEDKQHFEQPKCIRLYRKTPPKPVKGGTYILKPCLKKESNFKANVRLGRPGSPVIFSSVCNKLYGK